MNKKQRVRTERIRSRVLSEFQQQLALQKFQEERPQLWLQSQRVSKLVEVQNQLADEEFSTGSCFLHANTVSFSSFCVKKVIGIDLDTCQVTIEIYGDDNLEAGVVVLPLETIEWFGFPATAVPTGIHFEGFTGSLTNPTEKTGASLEKSDAKVAAKSDEKPGTKGGEKPKK